MPIAPHSLLMTARASAPSWSPLDLPNLVAWYDASDTATITDAGGGAVSQWHDKSGNGNHLVQGTGSNRPTTGARTINGLNALNFDGNDFLRVTGTSWSAWTILIVAEVDNLGDHRGLFCTGSANQPRLVCQVDTHFHYLDGDGNIDHGPGSNTISASTPFLVVDSDNGSTTHARWVNGYQDWPPTNTFGHTATLSGFVLGCINNGGFWFWDGAIAEVIVCNSTLSDTNRGDAETYLRAKWATP